MFEYLTVREHMELFQALLGQAPLTASTAPATATAGGDFPAGGVECSVDDSLRRLGLAEHAHKMAHALSGGMRRRLTLGLAFAGDPLLLLLDEPTSGCDSWTRELIRKDILLRREDSTPHPPTAAATTTSTHPHPHPPSRRSAVLVSTHHVDDVEVLSDRVWFLNDRYLAFDGSLDELTALQSSGAFLNTFFDTSSDGSDSGDGSGNGAGSGDGSGGGAGSGDDSGGGAGSPVSPSTPASLKPRDATSVNAPPPATSSSSSSSSSVSVPDAPQYASTTASATDDHTAKYAADADAEAGTAARERGSA